MATKLRLNINREDLPEGNRGLISYDEIAVQPITGACDRTRQFGSPERASKLS